jgi:hypothetical protein
VVTALINLLLICEQRANSVSAGSSKAERQWIAEMTWKGVKLYNVTGNSRESTL